MDGTDVQIFGTIQQTDPQKRLNLLNDIVCENVLMKIVNE